MEADNYILSVIDFINQQPGIENGRSLYRNTLDDTNVLVDYGIENLSCTGTWEEDDGRINKAYGNYSMAAAPDTENLFYGNIYGASEQFFSDLTIFDGEQDAEVLKQKNTVRGICYTWMFHEQTDRRAKRNTADRTATSRRQYFFL